MSIESRWGEPLSEAISNLTDLELAREYAYILLIRKQRDSCLLVGSLSALETLISFEIGQRFLAVHVPDLVKPVPRPKSVEPMRKKPGDK